MHFISSSSNQKTYQKALSNKKFNCCRVFMKHNLRLVIHNINIYCATGTQIFVSKEQLIYVVLFDKYIACIIVDFVKFF